MQQPQRASSRVIINTAAQYGRSLIGIAVSLYSTRLILQALGIDDYGIYALVAGVIAMLSFISIALVSTTQRFLSFHQANSSRTYLSILFGHILFLHIIFALIIIALLECIGPYIFDGFLNIAPERIPAAKTVYQCSIFMVIMSFLSAPFLALLIAHENIVYGSFIQIIDSFLRLGVALAISSFHTDKLLCYVYLLCGISLIDFFAYVIYTYHRYEECVGPRIRHLDKNLLIKISNFLIWQLYSTGCIVGRTQGTAIVLNRFYGTYINTAFGIAQQVSGAINFVSGSLINAINPQIIKAEGAGYRERMFTLTIIACKFGFFLLSIVVIPLIFNMELILEVWLHQIPPYAPLFCRVILITALFDQITLGLGTANQAIGNIRAYALIINSLKILTIPVITILLASGVALKYAIWAYAAMELLCALCRIPFLHYTGNLDTRRFIREVFISQIISLAFVCLAYSILTNYIHSIWTIVLCGIIITCFYVALFYTYSLTNSERLLINQLLAKIKNKFAAHLANHPIA